MSSDNVETKEDPLIKTKEDPCLNNLYICEAECCKYVVINLGKNMSLDEFNRNFSHLGPTNMAGNVYEFQIDADPELRKYFEYHRFEFINPTTMLTTFTPTEAKIRKNKLFVYRVCEHLGDNNLCSIFAKRPKCCDYSKKYEQNLPKFCVYRSRRGKDGQKKA